MAAMRRDSGSILGDEGSVNAANGEQMLKAQDDLDALSRGGGTNHFLTHKNRLRLRMMLVGSP